MKTFKLLSKSWIIMLLLIIPNVVFSQTGSVKIFSEVKNTSVFLDDVLKGVDVTAIDNVSVGSHYLKVTQDGIIIYSELIKVNPNEATIVLLKNDKDTQEKILAGKYKEIEEYKSKKIDILMDVRYVTNTTQNTSTTSKSNSIYFPGYYSVLGVGGTKTNAQTNTSSITYAQTDWFITQGGTKKLSYLQFASLINDTIKLNPYQRSIEYCKLNPGGKSKPDAGMIIGGVIAAAAGAWVLNYCAKKHYPIFGEDTPFGWMLLNVTGATASLCGVFVTIGGLTMKSSRNYPKELSYTLEDATLKTKDYNQKTKKELNLPEDFEPEKK